MPEPAQVKTIETIYSLLPPPAGPVFAVMFKFLDFIGYWDQPDPVAAAIKGIQAELAQIEIELTHVQDRLNQLATRLAQLENKVRLDRLSDLTRQAASIAARVAAPPDQLDQRTLIAMDAGTLVDVYLDEPDLWNWSDLQTVVILDADGHEQGPPEVVLLDPDFKVVPAQATYVFAMLTWLAAIELDTGGNLPLVLQRYGDRLLRHLWQNTVRDGWDDLKSPPVTLPENVMARITCSPLAQHPYARGRLCTYSIVCENVMRRSRFGVREVTQVMPEGDNVACTAASDLGIGDERDIEDKEGVDVFTQLAKLLEQVLSVGTLRQPYIERFASTPTEGTAFVYAIDSEGALSWYRQQPSAGSAGAFALGTWQGPQTVGTGWDRFTAVYPAGGNRFYGLDRDGTLNWYRHDGFNDGTQQWTGPVPVDHGWDGFTAIVPSSDGVLYAIAQDGELFWYRHDGFKDGTKQWTGPETVGHGWGNFAHVVSTGQGYLYAVTNEGELFWYHHTGFQDGSFTWEDRHHVGHGWQNFKQLFGVGDGVLYAVQPDGTVLWYRHDAWRTGGPESTWTGPVIAANGFTGYRQLFALMPSSPEPPH